MTNKEAIKIFCEELKDTLAGAEEQGFIEIHDPAGLWQGIETTIKIVEEKIK